MGRGVDDDRADLLVGEEFDGRIGEDAQNGCGVAAEETARAFVFVNVFHGGYDAEPGAGISCELRIRGLEENFDSVEGGNYGFGLLFRTLGLLYSFQIEDIP